MANKVPWICTKSDHRRFVHLICGDQSPVRCAPPLTKGGGGDYARDGTHQCTNVEWFNLGISYLGVEMGDRYIEQVRNASA